MRSVEDVKKLNQALVAFCLTNGRHHEQKSPIEQQCDDLCAILHMRLELLEHRLAADQGNPQVRHEHSEQDELATVLADLSLLAQSGALHEALGTKAGNLLATMRTVQSAGESELAAGLEHIDQGNYMRARGESVARMAILKEKQDLVGKKLGG